MQQNTASVIDAAQMILTFDDALDAIAQGETDWLTLTRRLGRNDLPAVLAEVAFDMRSDELAAAMMQAWVACEIPEDAVERTQWIEWFAEIGYRHNTLAVERPSELTLYRGGLDPNRMAWTADRDLAQWFRNRSGGLLWSASVPGHRLLAFYDNMIRPGESEFVIDPTGLLVEVVR